MAFLYVGDRERALVFYRDTLGPALRSSDDFGDFVDLGGGLLRMTVMADHKAHPHPVLGRNVEDIETAITALGDSGIAFTILEGMGQDARGIWSEPDGDKIAFSADPDGNVLTLPSGSANAEPVRRHGIHSRDGCRCPARSVVEEPPTHIAVILIVLVHIGPSWRRDWAIED